MLRKTFVTALALFGFTFAYFYGQETTAAFITYSENLYTKVKLFTSILDTIQRAYVEETDADELIENAIKGVVSKLDPHTNYLPADDFKMWNQSFEGYTGIGISFEIIQDKVTVMKVIESGPASKNGIQRGDKIIEINDTSVIGIKKEDFLKKMMGPAGTPINLLVESERWSAPKRKQLIREKILLKSLTQCHLIQNDIGYVKIERFTSKTSTELEKALTKLEAKGMKKLILDLRGNSGGYLNTAIDVTDKFIPGGHKILTTKGRLPSSFQEYYSTSETTHRLVPLVVLIDHGSASAAEIVAGAIQDLDRGLIIGKTSFGKGLVQSQYRFHDGSALLITTARYYTPSGRAIQRDYFEKTKDEYYRAAYDDQKRNQKNNIIAKPAFKTLSGRTVYGGGGITPDIWIDNQENVLSDNLRELYFSEKRFFYAFAKDFIRIHPELKRAKENFIENFQVTKKLYWDFMKYVKSTDPYFSLIDFGVDKSDIKFLLKREMAYLLWGSDARFKVNVARDKQLKEAIKYFPNAHVLLSMADLRN
ncbi:MAG: S41 family peptidase [bacterium]